MRKIVLGLAVSLDSFIEGPNGEFDWCFTDQDYGMNEFLTSVDTILYGRKSWEVLERMEGGLDMFPGKRNIIFSSTLGSRPAGEVVREPVADFVRSLKKEPGKNIWLFGGAVLSSTLLEENLIDEIWLSVHPILLGKGKKLFELLDHRVSLKLQHTHVYSTGLVSLKYTIQ